MSSAFSSDLERRLLLETTVFQEETTPETLQALLDQLEVPPAPCSPEAGWKQFQRACPEPFRARPSRRALLAAACVALAVSLPVVGALVGPSSSPAAVAQPEEARAVLSQLAGLSPETATALRAELPLDGVLSAEPAPLPSDAALVLLPFQRVEDAP